MKKFKFLFICVLFIYTTGCQSCSKDPIKPDPKPVTYCNVTVLPASGVTVIPSLPNGSTKVEYGKSISFDFNSAPNTKYKVLSNGVEVVSLRSGNTYYQVPSVTADLNIQIVSETVTFAVTASAGIGGTVTPNTTTADYGSDLTLNIVENVEYTLTSIKVNGVSVPVVKPFILTNVTATSDVKFEFTLTQILTLTNGADNKSRFWKLTNWDFYDANHIYEYPLILRPDQSTDKWYFYTNGRAELIDVAGNISVDYWNILPGNIYTQSNGARSLTIIQLNDTKFVYEQKGEFTLGVTEYKRSTYVRQ